MLQAAIYTNMESGKSTLSEPCNVGAPSHVKPPVLTDSYVTSRVSDQQRMIIDENYLEHRLSPGRRLRQTGGRSGRARCPHIKARLAREVIRDLVGLSSCEKRVTALIMRE